MNTVVVSSTAMLVYWSMSAGADVNTRSSLAPNSVAVSSRKSSYGSGVCQTHDAPGLANLTRRRARVCARKLASYKITRVSPTTQ